MRVQADRQKVNETERARKRKIGQKEKRQRQSCKIRNGKIIICTENNSRDSVFFIPVLPDLILKAMTMTSTHISD